MKIGAVDLFCGVGGLTYGLQSAGINVVAGIDVDNSCKYAYEHNNSSLFINKSIDEVKGKEVIELIKDYDIRVIVGCAPCQPFSKHQKNKNNRQDHKDWNLLYQFSRIVSECKPHIVSMENVPELINEKVFNDFVEKLKELKYHVVYQIVNVAEYGVAQRRRRLILLASKINDISLILPTTKENKMTVRDVIGKLPSIQAGQICDFDTLHQSSSLSDLNIKRIRASKPNGTWRDWPEELLLECHKKKSGKSYSSVYGRMGWDGLAPTITTQFNSYGTGRFGHPTQDRALTLREGALLQSFPMNYSFFENGKWRSIKSIARYIGNAVPPRLGEVIGLSIIESIPKNLKNEDGEL